MRMMALVMAGIGISWAGMSAPVTTGSLIEEMVDMHRLAEFPDPMFKTIQFSSYDHRSTIPGGPDWYANSDGFGKEPVPNFEAVIEEPEGDGAGKYLMCDVEGPGAIVRLWTARIGGTIQLYLDDADAPVYDGPAEAFFLRPYDPYLEGTKLEPEGFNGTLYQRNASYAPIPFAKRCRVVWTGNHKGTHFYEIQIRKYDEDAKVVTFSPKDLKKAARRIRRVVSILADTHANWECDSEQEPVPIEMKLAPRDSATALDLEGPGAIERLVLKVDAHDVDRALRQTVLHILCDRAPWGQVQAPVGDFFGAAPGVNPYTSVPFTVAPDGAMTCRYVMPFESSLRIVFDNRGDQEVAITGSVLPMDYEWTDASMHFRARWRIDHDLVAWGRHDMGVQDLPFLIARGKGVYVGTSVFLLNPNEVPSSGGNWWGEGDEKIFVDDDVRPSTFGTGSEDYFNYAWSARDIFIYPYCGQPRNDGPANRGFVVNYRWHVLDPLPFENSLAFYMELFSHERTEGFSYARLAYHYARPGLMDDHVPITGEDVRPLALPATWEPASRGAASNSVFLPCEDIAAENANTSFLEDGQWQGGRVMVWTPAQQGEQLKLTFAVDEDGDYDIALICMFRPGGGSFRATLDGEVLPLNDEAPVSLDDPYRVLSRVVGPRRKTLKAGNHELVLTATAAGKPNGLDFLQVRKR